jgi:predicted ATPase
MTQETRQLNTRSRHLTKACDFQPLTSHHTQIALNSLNARNVPAIVGELAVRQALTHETVAAVLERTCGVPLFVEELTRAVLERGNVELIGRGIRVTLHDSPARLDRLGPAKEVAQVGAVIGSEFSYEWLCAVHPIVEEDLQRALRSLSDGELLYVRGIEPEATYQFKHALIRDAAYEALLKSRRKELHLIIAGSSMNWPGHQGNPPEVLAQHYPGRQNRAGDSLMVKSRRARSRV